MGTRKEKSMKEIKKPGFMQEASTGKGHVWMLEMLICMVVYFVGSIIMSVGQTPGMLAYFLQSKDYIQMMRTGEIDMEAMTSLIQNMPEWMTIFMLFSEIFLIVTYLMYCRYFEKRKLHTMGFVRKGFVLQYIKGLLIGTAAFGAAYLVCLGTGSVQFEGAASDMIPIYILLYFGGYMVQGMAEEVICRGFLLVSLSRKYSVWFSAAASSLLFMALHFANNGMTVLSMVNLFLFGMFMALLFIQSGNIWIIAAVHSVWNFMQGNVMGVQVSGLAKQNSIFLTTFTDGRDFLNGGSFGLEGGLAVTVTLLTAIGIVYYRMNKKGMLVESRIPSSVAEGQEKYVTEGERVYRNDSAEFTETPWRPDRTASSEDKADLLQEEFVKPGEIVQTPSEEQVHTVFNADYFSDRE